MGLSYQHSTNAYTPLDKNAILKKEAALHISMDGSSKYSSSTKIGILRRLLKGEYEGSGEIVEAFTEVSKGNLRLVVNVGKADEMAALVALKEEVAPKMGMTFLGAEESWMVSFSLPI